jgi:N-acetylmuramoyl-L-alanine amidase
MAIIKKVIIHCADTPADMDVGVDEIRRWHVEGNGWSDIGYHYVIRRSGLIEPGRDLDGDGDVEEETGAHVYGNNRGTLGICMVGGKPNCNFTAAQWSSAAWLVKDILARHGLTGADVYGHRDFDKGKQCPTFDAKAWASSL